MISTKMLLIYLIHQHILYPIQLYHLRIDKQSGLMILQQLSVLVQPEQQRVTASTSTSKKTPGIRSLSNFNPHKCKERILVIP